MTNKKMSIVLVGYKEKNLANAVKHIKSVTHLENFVHVFDQHPITHEDGFLNIPDCEYEHKIWDDMHGPAYRRSTKVYDTMFDTDYVCIISADITLSDGWDSILIPLLDKKDVVFSGSGKITLKQDSLFSLSPEYVEENTFNITQMIDRNFIFAKSEAFQKIVMPEFLKYHGENEYLSISFLSAEYDIMSIPAKMYKDSCTRSIENTYHTFSLEHNYNIVIDIMYGKEIGRYKISEDGVNKFLKFHNISMNNIHRLPYQTNDVSYDPSMLKMHDVSAIRFVAGTKAVY